MKKGIVIKSTGSRYKVRSGNETFVCTIKGKFRISGIKATNPVAVGDVVQFEENPSDLSGVIFRIDDRKNFIIRRSVNLSKQTHIIAANVDEAVMIASLVNPKTHLEFIDRFLASCESYGIKSTIIFNKSDLNDNALNQELAEIKNMYEKIGYTVFSMSVKNKQGINEFKQHIVGKTVVFSGNSGVGKTSLINLLIPDIELKTSEISETHLAGMHTTTFAEMFEYENLKIIDTPGIKSFGLPDIRPEDVSGWFPEIFEYQKKCRFYNCTHSKEPGCAVKSAVDIGEISASRYRSYLSILNEDQEKYRPDLYKE